MLESFFQILEIYPEAIGLSRKSWWINLSKQKEFACLLSCCFGPKVKRKVNYLALTVKIHANNTKSTQCGWARYKREFLFRNFLFPSFMHSWLWRVYIYSTCSHDLLPFKFVGCVCRAVVGEASRAKREENKNKIFLVSAKKKLLKKAKRKTVAESLVCMWRRMMTAWRSWSEEDPGPPSTRLHTFNIPAAGIFMDASCY